MTEPRRFAFSARMAACVRAGGPVVVRPGVGTLRAPSVFNLDAMVAKRFRITESKNLQFRAEFFNALNHVSWGPPGRDISTPTSFGQITAQAQGPRNIQLGLKLFF